MNINIITRTLNAYTPQDADAATYISAVEAADGSALDEGVKELIDIFVAGLKDDALWTSIESACILAGAKTLSGALVPLKGLAPTNNGFLASDYSRSSGIIGDGTSKYLDSNRNNNADLQNDHHLSVYITEMPTAATTNVLIGSGTSSNTGRSILFFGGDNRAFAASRSTATDNSTTGSYRVDGFIGVSRDGAASLGMRSNFETRGGTETSQDPHSSNFHVFANNAASPLHTDARMSWFSIGAGLDLAALDGRLQHLMGGLEDY